MSKNFEGYEAEVIKRLDVIILLLSRLVTKEKNEEWQSSSKDHLIKSMSDVSLDNKAISSILGLSVQTIMNVKTKTKKKKA